jgi:hypothetical protein
MCSLLWQRRHALAFDGALCADLLQAFIAPLARSLKGRA